MSKSDELEQKFKEEFSLDLLGDVIKSIVISYQVARDYAYSHFQAPIARDLLPYERRANIDNNLLVIAENHGIRAAIDKNVGKNCSHVKYMSRSFTVTANAVNYPSEAIREAKFRSSYGEANYPVLFPEMEPKFILPYYATILHGWYYPELSKPGFIFVGFPLPGSSQKYIKRFNLATYCKVEDLFTEMREDVLIKFKNDEDD